MAQLKGRLSQNFIYLCYNSESFDVNIVNQEHEDKIINTNGTRAFNVIQPTMPTSTNERESFHYTIENITEDETRTLQRI